MSALESLPDELVHMIVRYLPHAVDALALSHTCRKMARTLASEWYGIALRSNIFEHLVLFPHTPEYRAKKDRPRPGTYDDNTPPGCTYDDIIKFFYKEVHDGWEVLYDYDANGADSDVEEQAEEDVLQNQEMLEEAETSREQQEDDKRMRRRPRVDYRRKILLVLNGRLHACKLCLGKKPRDMEPCCCCDEPRWKRTRLSTKNGAKCTACGELRVRLVSSSRPGMRSGLLMCRADAEQTIFARQHQHRKEDGRLLGHHSVEAVLFVGDAEPERHACIDVGLSVLRLVASCSRGVHKSEVVAQASRYVGI